MKTIKKVIEWTLVILFLPIVWIAKRISELFDLWAMNKYWFEPLRKSAVKPVENSGSDGNNDSENTEPETK